VLSNAVPQVSVILYYNLAIFSFDRMRRRQSLLLSSYSELCGGKG